MPLFKKHAVFNPGNYRGIHLTTQLSKVVERLVKALYVPYIYQIEGYGPNQYAYTHGRGARDVLAKLVLVWIDALSRGRKIVVYCSDVSGAFDRVEANRLIAKLRSKRLHPDIIATLTSWLQQRTAHVLVGGCESDAMPLKNMVFQGTVLGPILWNIFFEDARTAVNEKFFTETVFADDLNAYRIYAGRVENDVLLQSASACQAELHEWGKANQVTFDPTKESVHILSLTEPTEGTFRQLGVDFDGTLSMGDAVSEVVTSAGWKLRTIVRTRRHYTDAELVLLYKSHLLSYIEYRTSAIYHATRAVLQRLDAVQTRFLRDANLDEVTALMEFSLAPLAMRRDIAMLGMIHRAALGEGPPQLRQMFKRRLGSYMLEDPYAATSRSPLVRRSAWGLVPVYNRLGSGAQSILTVKDFQAYLQARVKRLIVRHGVDDWMHTYSPR